MSLSLHAEYLLGYLAGARSVHVRDVIPLALVGSPDPAQQRALLKAVALGMSDGRKGRSLREAHEVRMHVLTLLTRESAPSRLGRFQSDAAAAIEPEVAHAAEANENFEDLLRQAAEIQ